MDSLRGDTIAPAGHSYSGTMSVFHCCREVTLYEDLCTHVCSLVACLPARHFHALVGARHGALG